MKIVVLGTRGFPRIQGGVEAHCENLYPLLAKNGCDVVVFTRKFYQIYRQDSFKGVRLVPLSCPKSKFLEAFVHTFRGIFAASKLHPDILHIHAIGPSLWVILARLLGMKVVMTHHGPDYERKKWNWVAKFILRLGERWGCMGANKVICVSRVIAESVKKKFNVEAIVISNGVVMPEISTNEEILKKFGLVKGKYILSVGRFVPEKGFHDLIEAFARLQGHKAARMRDEWTRDEGRGTNGRGTMDEWKLVIVGRADHEDAYSKGLKLQVTKSPNHQNIVLTGFLSGEPLQELYSHAGLFVLPSYYEGLPIVLLEAMSYGLSCIVSDISANKEVELPEDRFFKAGNIEQLAEKIIEFISKPLSQEEKYHQVSLISEKYDWERIAHQTLEAYRLVSGF